MVKYRNLEKQLKEKTELMKNYQSLIEDKQKELMAVASLKIAVKFKDIEVEKTKCELIIKNGKTCGYLFIENSGKILEYINLDADITQEKSLPFMMARCIDVRAALTKLNVAHKITHKAL